MHEPVRPFRQSSLSMVLLIIIFPHQDIESMQAQHEERNAASQLPVQHFLEICQMPRSGHFYDLLSIITYLASNVWCKAQTVELPGIALLHMLPEGMTCGITYKHSTDPLLDQRKSIQRIRRTCRVSAGKHGPHICTSQSMVKRKVALKQASNSANKYHYRLKTPS